MAIKKQYLKSRPVCKVTFKIPAEVGNAAETANIVGEFNDWSFTAHPMKRLKSGALTATLDMEKGRAYQFSNILEKNHWENESEADKLVPSPYGDSENSVIIV